MCAARSCTATAMGGLSHGPILGSCATGGALQTSRYWKGHGLQHRLLQVQGWFRASNVRLLACRSHTGDGPFSSRPPQETVLEALSGIRALSSSSIAVSESKEGHNLVSNTSKDLLITGPGVLGRLIAQEWMKENVGSAVVGQTITVNHHDELRSLGISPVIKGEELGRRFPYVMFCAPPSGSSDYAAELRLAGEQWNGEGVLLFTSSSAVCDCSDNGNCDEDTPTVPLGRSPRTDVLLRAEEEVLRVGGTIVRLAGLYTLNRGPHAFWAKKGTVDARGDHVLNLIHYQDAASLCVTIMKKGFRKEIFLGCDNHPLSRQELMDIANQSGKLQDKFVAFTGMDGPLGKKMKCDKTRAKTGWQPRYKSFAECVGIAV